MDPLTALQRRREEFCRCGQRQGECARCTPRKDEPLPPLSLVPASLPPEPTQVKRRRVYPNSQANIVLAAARRLPPVFTRSQLVLSAWDGAKKTFGLQGFELEYPDSNKVLSYLYGSKGLIRRGEIVQGDDGLLEVAAQARE